MKYLPDFKKCSKCGKIKSQSEFSFNSTTSTGLESWCRICIKYKHSLRGTRTGEI